MSEDDKLNSVVSHIYDAVLNPGLWGAALERLARFVSGEAGTLCLEDLTAKFVSAGHDIGSDLEYMQIHSELYGDYFDPLTAVSQLEVEEVVSLLELVPHREDCARLFYQEHRTPRGHATKAAIGTREDDDGLLGLHRGAPDEVIDDAMRRRISLVAPHIRRAILIGKVFGRKFGEAAIFASILDQLNAGLFLIDRDGRIIHANTTGRRILGTDDFLRAINGRLVARDTDANRAMQAAFARKGALEMDAKGIALSLTAEDRDCHVVHVLPQRLAAGPGTARSGAVTAAVVVCKTRLELPLAPDIIGRAYQLTPTELRVLLALVNVGGISEVAASLGVSVSTIKTHVGRLFAKTGSARQADLVKLVAGFRPMFVA
ncbi:putative transcriptional regulator, LuxR family [Bradyrhizobium oligotrophicum S58]|uniref:Putative transcriptional regulator, LuxR family n=1 Tax=Bradyrhizobium oligotrophicum S58 TaxID=1245469 RepID=M4ZGG7_9BRAD|nr:PAS domain-containing protein [Bradyrhizobium oligotrophicum]BAM92854.1 putative transcriptional regulator, LuxR family [Bradyrhizobium oligotrophicum S58]